MISIKVFACKTNSFANNIIHAKPLIESIVDYSTTSYTFGNRGRNLGLGKHGIQDQRFEFKKEKKGDLKFFFLVASVFSYNFLIIKSFL